MSKEMVFTLVAAIFYIAIIYMLVRPGSTGPALVNTISSTFADLVRGAVGYSYNPSSGQWSAPTS
jgi:hypothetical protein